MIMGEGADAFWHGEAWGSGWASEAMEAEGQTRGTGLHSVGSDSRSGWTGWKLSES